MTACRGNDLGQIARACFDISRKAAAMACMRLRWDDQFDRIADRLKFRKSEQTFGGRIPLIVPFRSTLTVAVISSSSGNGLETGSAGRALLHLSKIPQCRLSAPGGHRDKIRISHAPMRAACLPSPKAEG